MRREYGGQLCAYCRSQISTTDDHVVGRGFVPARLRAHLPKVPACKTCNSRKSDLERYAMAVFPFGAQEPIGAEVLQTKVQARLANDQRLLRKIAAGSRDAVYIDSQGGRQRRLAVPFDWQRSAELFRMLVLGLLWHHNRAPMPVPYVIRLLALTERGRDWFRGNVLALSSENYQEVALAGGAFSYRFTRSPDDPFFSAWILDVYGSLSICVSLEDGELIRVFVAALTGPEQVAELGDRIESQGARTGHVVPLPGGLQPGIGAGPQGSN